MPTARATASGKRTLMSHRGASIEIMMGAPKTEDGARESDISRCLVNLQNVEQETDGCRYGGSSDRDRSQTKQSGRLRTLDREATDSTETRAVNMRHGETAEADSPMGARAEDWRR